MDNDQIADFLAHVAADRAITTVALTEFGIDATALKRLERAGQIYVCEHRLRRTHESRQDQTVGFVCRDERTADRPGTTLRHYAGIAEMRRRLLCPRWTLTMLERPAHDGEVLPDAIWHAPGIEHYVAIEFDTSSQPLWTVKEKGRHYHGHGISHYWGTTSARRAENLRATLESVAGDALSYWVFVVDWMGR